MTNIEDELEYILNELNELEDNGQAETAAYEDFHRDYLTYDYEWEGLRQEKEAYEKMLNKVKIV